MSVKAFLQGKWLGHPLHPALVHVPLGLWPAALFFDLLGFFGLGGNLLVQMAFFSILLGLIVAAIAMIPGWADWTGIKRGKPAWKLGLFHIILNVAASLVWLINLLVRRPVFQEAQGATGLELQLSLAGTILLIAGAWLGGRMVFNHGTSIARHSKQRLRKIAEKGKATLPDE